MRVMREIVIELPDYIEIDVFENVWDQITAVINREVSKHDWFMWEVDK